MFKERHADAFLLVAWDNIWPDTADTLRYSPVSVCAPVDVRSSVSATRSLFSCVSVQHGFSSPVDQSGLCIPRLRPSVPSSLTRHMSYGRRLDSLGHVPISVPGSVDVASWLLRSGLSPLDFAALSPSHDDMLHLYRAASVGLFPNRCSSRLRCRCAR